MTSTPFPYLSLFAKTSPFLFIVLLCGALPRGAVAQSPRDPANPVAFMQPPRGAKAFSVDRIEGQAVVARPARKWFNPMPGLRIALFDEKHAPVSTVISGESGQFQFGDVAPGAYTLVVDSETLPLLSIPLRIRTRTAQGAPAEPALLLVLHSKTDQRKSVATLIANKALRAELLERVEKDQAIRHELIQAGVDHPDKEIQTRMAAIDAQNLARIKEIVCQHGWPGPALVGIDGTEAAFLLVQHSPHDFQKEMLPHIRGAYRSSKLDGQSYALLLDRVLVGDGQPHVYGTQTLPFSKWHNHEPALAPIADETHVDQRRARLGLFPLAEYVKMLKEAYFP